METIAVIVMLVITLLIMFGILIYRTIKAIIKIKNVVQSFRTTTYKPQK